MSATPKHSIPATGIDDSADGLAVGLSLLCILHCAALPILVALMPATSRFLELPEGVHIIVFVLALPVSGPAIVTGFRRHGFWLPLALACGGLLLIGVGALAGLPALIEAGVTVAGSCLLALGHYRNWQARRHCLHQANR